MSSTTESSDTLTLTLPDGATRDVSPGTPARDVVASIGSRLLQAAIAVVVEQPGVTCGQEVIGGVVHRRNEVPDRLQD